jgi:hypothetical protein
MPPHYAYITSVELLSHEFFEDNEWQSVRIDPDWAGPPPTISPIVKSTTSDNIACRLIYVPNDVQYPNRFRI